MQSVTPVEVKAQIEQPATDAQPVLLGSWHLHKLKKAKKNN